MTYEGRQVDVRNYPWLARTFNKLLGHQLAPPKQLYATAEKLSRQRFKPVKVKPPTLFQRLRRVVFP